MQKLNTKERFVAFIDILGFKNLVENYSHEFVFNKLNTIVNSIIELEKIFKDKRKQWIKTWIFSDSIMLVSIDDSEYSADVMLLLSANVVAKALQQELLVKGAIAFGEFTADYKKSIFFGKPLIDAFQLEEEMKVSGIILHHSFERKLKEMKYKDVNLLADGRSFDYLTPMKFGTVKHLHLNWLEYAKNAKDEKGESISFEKCKRLIERIYFEVSGQPRIYIDNTLILLSKSNEIITSPINTNLPKTKS